MSEVSYIKLTWESATHAGEVDAPTTGDPANRDEIERAARRSFWSLIAAGYGDVDDMRVSYNGEWIPMGPQKPQLSKGDRVIAHDPEEPEPTTLVVCGEPWFNKADEQWYYPIEDPATHENGDMTDYDLASGTVVKVTS